MPKQLRALSRAISLNGSNIRNLNLSYNILNFNPKSPDFEHSNQFMKNITQFFKTAEFVNHVNFSGMNFKKQQILDLLDQLRNLMFLSSIHLSDNGICD